MVPPQAGEGQRGLVCWPSDCAEGMTLVGVDDSGHKDGGECDSDEGS